MRRISAVHIDKFYKDSLILTLSNMTTGTIAFIFSIILSRELGAEGLGLYGLISPVYGFLLCLTSDGLITAISRTSALYHNRKELSNLYRTISTVFVFILLGVSCVAFLVLVCHNIIAIHIVRDARAAGAIMMLCPALIFVPMSAILKGYFYGLGQYKTTASVDIFEKLLRVIVLLSTVSIISPGSEVSKTVTIAFFALSVGELVSMTLLFICYRLRKTKMLRESASSSNYAAHRFRGKSKSRIQLMFDVLVISVPLCLEGILASSISAISALVLPRRLVSAGYNYSEALAMIGRFGGMALNITTLPYIIVSSMLTVLVPELSLHISKKNFWSAEERITQVLRIAALVGISTAIICLKIPETLGVLFYGRNDLASMIKYSAPICLIMFVSLPTYGILNCLGKQNTFLKHSLIHSVLGLLLTFILAGIPTLNIYGHGLSIMLTYLTSLVLNVREIRKICEIKVNRHDLITLLLSGILAWLAAEFVVNLTVTAHPLIRTAATVITCFSTMFILSRLVSNCLYES
jgi:stage V sporulation protein B